MAKTVRTRRAERDDTREDAELRAMGKVFGALQGLDPEAQDRVLYYVERRLDLKRESIPRQETSSRDSWRRGGDDEAARRETERETSSLDTKESDQDTVQGAADGLEGISAIAQKWMRRNSLTTSQLSALFSLGVDEIDLVAKKVSGRNAKEKLRNILLLEGVAGYLGSGVARIDTAKLKHSMAHYGAEVGGNFATYLKEWASEIAGSKSAGLTLTSRGLASAKDLITSLLATPKKSD